MYSIDIPRSQKQAASTRPKQMIKFFVATVLIFYGFNVKSVSPQIKHFSVYDAVRRKRTLWILIYGRNRFLVCGEHRISISTQFEVFVLCTSAY